MGIDGDIKLRANLPKKKLFTSPPCRCQPVSGTCCLPVMCWTWHNTLECCSHPLREGGGGAIYSSVEVELAKGMFPLNCK